MIRTYHARPRANKTVWEVLYEVIGFCAHNGQRILRIHRDGLCCEVTVEC